MIRPPDCFEKARLAEGIELPPERLEVLSAFVGLLLKANRDLNLTAIRDPDEAWLKHVLESLALARRVEDCSSVVDLGSGAGLPGIPLAVAMPDTNFVLIEATGKKARFIESSCAELGLGNVSVLPVRAEQAGRSAGHRGRHDAVLARAVGSLAELVELGLPLLRIGGRLLAVKGGRAPEEIAAADHALTELGGRLLGSTPLLKGGGESVVVEVLKELPAPEKYPRRSGMPHKRPLRGS
jgi:16S rRNA (guanine527-N7)-methyltransferase